MRRRLTRRQKNKRNKQIIMVSTICLLIVMGVGYAAFQTNLSIIAKGNIKEKKAADMLRELCTTESGDGLYIDIYEDGKCTYKGVNPNNYITFNNETWRIISVENDKTIKIIKQSRIGSYKWDSSNSNNWDRPSDIKTYLNGEYLATMTTNQDKIVSHTWNIGPVINENNNLIDQINGENKVQSQLAYIGLITVSEYLRANSNIEQCENFALNSTNHNICMTTNWIFNEGNTDYMETITPVYNSSNLIYLVDLHGPSSSMQSNIPLTGPTNMSQDIYPVLYLSPDITLSGTGTQQDPYIITN